MSPLITHLPQAAPSLLMLMAETVYGVAAAPSFAPVHGVIVVRYLPSE